MSGLQPADFTEPSFHPWPEDEPPAPRARPKRTGRARPGPSFVVARTTLAPLPSLASPPPPVAAPIEPEPTAPSDELVTFELGRVRPVRDGGRLIATAESLIELRGETVLVEMQVVRWPDGRTEAKASPFWHPQFGWDGASLVPATTRDAIATEVMARLGATHQ